MAVQHAVRVYHDLLTDRLAADTHEELERLQRLKGLTFGERPLSTVLRPRFLTPLDYRFMRQRVAVLLEAFDVACRAALESPEAMRQFGLTEIERELVAIDPGFPCPMPTARLDAFFVSQEEFKFTEFNAETPAATGYNDVIAEVFLALPAMHAFARRYAVLPTPTRQGVLHVLLDCYRRFRGVAAKPRIAIVDWEDVPTYSEFVIFRDYFRSLGYECEIIDPRRIEYSGGALRAGDFQIDLIYKRVLIGELIDRCGLDHPIVRAVRDRAVCMVNPFRGKILYKKASFAVLTDERNAAWFNAEQRKAIADHIPWTRMMEERRTVVAGKEVDLIPYVLEHREHLALKPNDDYGGAGITLGWTVDDAAWKAAVADALTKPYVVQERVSVPSEPFPSFVDGKLLTYDRMLDTAPFVWNGQFMDGCLTRISTAALLNVTAGGGSTVPTFLVEPRV